MVRYVSCGKGKFGIAISHAKGKREEYLLQRGEGDDYRITRKKERLLNIEMGV